MKATGEPNVPFNEVTFGSLGEDCLNIPMDLQGTVSGVWTVMMEKETALIRENQLQSFRVPIDMSLRVPTKWTTYKDRWPTEVQVASHMFLDSQLIEANFALFRENEFAEVETNDQVEKTVQVWSLGEHIDENPVTLQERYHLGEEGRHWWFKEELREHVHHGSGTFPVEISGEMPGRQIVLREALEDHIQHGEVPQEQLW